MNKAILFVTIVFLTITSACGKNNPVNIVTPTETASPLISFAIPQDGETIEYEAMYFQVDPVPSAEGFAWTFTQNGRVLLDTFKEEQRLTDTVYEIPNAVSLNKNFIPGALQIQVRARINGTWTASTTITVYLPKRAATKIAVNTQTPISGLKPTQIPTHSSFQAHPSTPTSQPGWLTYVNDLCQ